MNTIKKQYGLIRDGLNFSKDKIDKLKKDQIALIKDMSDEPLNEYDLSLQEFFISGFNKTKFASMIYGVSRSKWEGFDYRQKSFNPRTETLMRPSDPSSSSFAKNGYTLNLCHLVKKKVQTNKNL